MSETAVIIRTGFELTLAPEFSRLEEDALGTAALVRMVKDEPSNQVAFEACAEIKQLLREVERSRKAVKRPVIDLGQKIEDLAAKACGRLQAELARIEGLLEEHRQAQLEEKRILEAARQREIEEQQRRQREAEEAARKLAAEAEVAKTKKDRDRLAAEALKAAATAQAQAQIVEETKTAAPSVALPPSARGQSWVDSWDYEVIDIHTLYLAHSRLVKTEDRRQEILAYVNSPMCPQETLPDGTQRPKVPGLRIKSISRQRVAAQRQRVIEA